MSDIGIRNMDMPKTCKECIEMEIPVRCRVIKQEPVTAIMTGYNRPKDCPLVELPQHGDLIDRSELPTTSITDYAFEGHTVVEYGDVQNAPTILEASEE